MYLLTLLILVSFAHSFTLISFALILSTLTSFTQMLPGKRETY